MSFNNKIIDDAAFSRRRRWILALRISLLISKTI